MFLFFSKVSFSVHFLRHDPTLVKGIVRENEFTHLRVYTTRTGTMPFARLSIFRFHELCLLDSQSARAQRYVYYLWRALKRHSS